MVRLGNNKFQITYLNIFNSNQYFIRHFLFLIKILSQILNQDAAKTFLFQCDPSKLYEFFMRATQLEDCKRDYNKVWPQIIKNVTSNHEQIVIPKSSLLRLKRFVLQAAEEKNVSQALIQDKAETLPDIKKEVHIWEKKYQVNEKITTPCVEPRTIYLQMD